LQPPLNSNSWAGLSSGLTPEVIEAIQRLLAQKASNTATSFAIANKLGYRASPQSLLWMLNHTTQRPTNPYDVAFLISSARRITEAMTKGKTADEAGKVEQSYDKMHTKANQVRTQSLQQTEKVMLRNGPLVGWYAHYDSKTSPACRLANGHNFDAMQGTVIGYPGSVHPHCRCYAGPPHANGQMVDDVLQANPVGV
jgi:hypothetical protein